MTNDYLRFQLHVNKIHIDSHDNWVSLRLFLAIVYFLILIESQHLTIILEPEFIPTLRKNCHYYFYDKTTLNSSYNVKILFI